MKSFRGMAVRPGNFGAGILLFILFSIPVWAADTPLHEAAIQGDLTAVERLLKEGADINIRDQEKRTPLQRAIEHKQTEMARWLVDHGAKTNAEDRFYLRRMGIGNPAAPSPPTPLTAKKHRSPEPGVYDEIARATGGAVYRFPKGNMDGLADIMMAMLDTQNQVNREIDLAGTERLRVLVEPDWARMVITLNVVGGKSRIHWVDGQGINVNGDRPPGGIKKIELENGAVFILLNPAPGNWLVTLEGQGNVHFKVDAKKGRGGASRQASRGPSHGQDSSGGIEIYKMEFVELMGRPGHEGYFKTERPLVPGSQMLAEVTLFGEPTGVALHLVSPDGGALPEGDRTLSPITQEDKDYLFEIPVPLRPFQVKLTGRDVDGTLWTLQHPQTFTPRNDLLAVDFAPRPEMTIEDCQMAKAFLQKIDSDSPQASAFLRCNLTGIEPLRMEFEMRVYLPSGGEDESKFTFFPDPRYKYDARQCTAILEFLERFEERAVLNDGVAHRTASCDTVGEKPRLEIHVSLAKE